MTFVLPNQYSPIKTVKSGTCSSIKGSILDYEIGKNLDGVLFVRIVQSSGGGSTSFKGWFAICDLAQLFAIETIAAASSFEPFDQAGNPLPTPGNNNPPAFLKAILCDIVRG